MFTDLLKIDFELYSVVSFDVFDTLIHRICQFPHDVYDVVNYRLLADFNIKLPESLYSNFTKERIEAERLARIRQKERYGTYEITIRDIYHELQSKFHLENTLSDQLMKIEFEIELNFCYANEDMLMFFTETKKRRKKIICCTDMYLPEDIIKEMLAKCGYSGVEFIFVSGFVKKSKAEGDIYEFICDALGVKPEEVLHIGDNYNSDVVNAKAKGISAYYVSFFDRNRNDVDDLSSIPLISKLIYGMHRKYILFFDKNKIPSFESIGFNYLGPLIFGYLIWLFVQVSADTPDKVFFLARDSYLFEKLFRYLSSKLGVCWTSEYVYASRKSTLFASFNDFSFARLWYLFGGKKRLTVKDYLSKLNIDSESCRAHFDKIGLQLEDIVEAGNSKMHAGLARMPEKILQSALLQSILPKQYFENLFQDSKKVSLIDVGWLGNIQSSIERLLSRPDITIKGNYLGTFHAADVNLSSGNASAWLFNFGTPNEIENIFLSGGVEILEFALTAPHGTTTGYKFWNGNVVPILDDSIEDIEYQENAKKIQEGILKFVYNLWEHLGITSIEQLQMYVTKDWSLPFQKLVLTPTKDEAALLGEISHSDAVFADSHERNKLAAFVPNNTPNYNDLLQLERARSFWKSGFDIRNR